MLLCMRTTLDIDDHLYREVKKKASEDGKTFKRVVEEAIREYLMPSKPSEPFKLKVITTSGELMPGVNIDDRDSLYEIMEGRS